MNEIPARNTRVLVVLGLTAAAFILRVWDLGHLGFRWDEDLTGIAVKAVMEHGYPLLDAGMVYTRFLPLQYLLAAWTSIFGFSEGSLRFPIVLFGTAMVPITYVITKDLVNTRAALLAAAIVAFDFWQVELSRSARMYAPFFAIFGLYIIAVYRGGLWGRSGWKMAAIPLGLLAVFLFQISILGALLVLVPLVLDPSKRREPFSYVVSFSLLLAFLWFKDFSDEMWNLSRQESIKAMSEVGPNLMGTFPLLTQIYDGLSNELFVPSAELFFGLLETTAGSLVWLFLLAASTAFALWISRGSSPLLRAVAICIATVAMFHQFTLALILIVMYAGLKRRGAAALLESDTRKLAVFVIVALALWMLVSIWLGYSVADLKFVIKQLFEYPRFRLFWAYPLYRPLMTVAAVVGFVILFDRWARERGDSSSGMLILGLLCTYCTVGMFATDYSHFRYVMHADMFFIPIVAAGMLAITDYVVRLSRSRLNLNKGTANRDIPSMTVVIVLFIVVANPLRAVLAVDREYVLDSWLENAMRLGSYPDYKTTSEYILANRQEGDQILTLEPREYYNYVGPINGWIQSRNFESQAAWWGGKPHDRYIGAPILQTLDEVTSVIDTHIGRTWLPFNSRILTTDRRSVDDEIASYLEANMFRRAMVGADDSTIVLLFED